MTIHARPHILQCGKAKSGNFWLYSIIQHCLRHADVDTTTFIQTHPIHDLAQHWDLSFAEQSDIDVLDVDSPHCFYRISSIFRHPVEDLDAYVQSTPHVWTHSPYHSDATPRVFSKFDTTVYLIRDPRDVALSMARFVFTPYMQKYYPTAHDSPASYLEANLEQSLRNWIHHVGPYLVHANTLGLHVVFYERLLLDFDTELQRLLKATGLDLNEDQQRMVSDAVTFHSMKEKDPEHVQKGKAGKWMERFSDAQKERALHIAEPMLEHLDYPLRATDPPSIRPSVPSSFSNSNLRAALLQAKYPTVPSRFKRWVRSVYATMTP